MIVIDSNYEDPRMPFFQNPFTSDFEGYWVLADRQASLTFKCPRNAGRGIESVTAWMPGPYDLSSNDADGNATNVLTLNFTISADYKSWTTVPLLITGVTPSAILPSEVAGSLNNLPAFSDWFTASLQTFDKNPNGLAINDRIAIKQKLPSTKMRFYVSTGGAESQIKFNKLAGVAALPLYFARHTIANRYLFPDSQNALIQLGTTGEQAKIIDNAVDFANNSLGYVHTAVPTDSALLRGRSGLFMVTNGSTSGTTIVYPAGAVAGDMAKKTVTSGSNIIEEPYTLLAADILAPP
jgi:hypothetical protein